MDFHEDASLEINGEKFDALKVDVNAVKLIWSERLCEALEKGRLHINPKNRLCINVDSKPKLIQRVVQDLEHLDHTPFNCVMIEFTESIL